MNSEEFDVDSCHNTIKMSSKEACSTRKFTNWYHSEYVHKDIIATLLCLIGFFFLFFGNYFAYYTTSLIIALAIGIFLKAALFPLYPIYFFTRKNDF